MKRILAVRQDNNGDVILVGPAIRALATQARVDLLCGPRGRAAGRLLPCVADVLEWEAAWIDAEPHAVDRTNVDALVDRLSGKYDEAVIFTSFHQSPLPMALLLRMAGIVRIGAISIDYPGSLLDVRHRVDDDVHEVERALSLVRAMGYALPDNDDGRLRLHCLAPVDFEASRYVVVHPGCTMTARTWSPRGFFETTKRLGDAGYSVAVTGSADEQPLTSYVASGHRAARDFGGATSFAQFASLIKSAAAVVCGNTATTHVAAAVGTPVVEIFPPTIPFARFYPWKTPYRVFGNHAIDCAGCRARRCPREGHPCVAEIDAREIVDAVLAVSCDALEAAR